MPSSPLTLEQCRAGRALLGWSQDQLAAEARVAKGTIVAFEASRRIPYERTLRDLREAMERAGVTFLADEETTAGGRGVRFTGAV